MWSLGCILVELHTGSPLFDGQDELDQLLRIIQVLGMPPKSMIEQCPHKNELFVYDPQTENYKLKQV